MAHIALEDFVREYREELIRRCQAKVASREPAPDKAEGRHGVPLFLEQLCEQLRDGASRSDDIGESAKSHGHDLLHQGFTIEQVPSRSSRWNRGSHKTDSPPSWRN